MSETGADPRCPECGGPIGQTATYCMHCSADLTDELAAADSNNNGVWDEAEAPATGTPEYVDAAEKSSFGIRAGVVELSQAIVEGITGISSTDTTETGELLSPDSFLDDSLTVIVGIIGGLLVGIVGTVILGIVTGSAWGVVGGIFGWLTVTAYLVRRRTVQAAVAKSAYAVAIVLLLVPMIALSPVTTVEGGISGRIGFFFVLLLFVVIPAGFAAAIGWIASRFIPTGPDKSEA